MSDGTVWREICATLKTDIREGRYPPGGKLPTEANLAARFGVNRHTVRRALAEMHGEGLTHARRGAGVFVTGHSTAYPIGRRVRFHASIEAAGQVPSKEITRLETIPAGDPEAEMLDLRVGDIVHIWEGIALADGVPLAFFRSWFPARRLPNLKETLRETRSVTAALSSDGITDYVRRTTEVAAERAGALQARHLNLPATAPVLCTVSLNVDSGGRPVEFGRTWFAGDRVRLVVGDDET